MQNNRMGYDCPKLTRDEAVELCVYHLRMATSLFQLVPDDQNAQLNNEIDHACEDDWEKLAAKAWADNVYAAYEEMKDRD